MSSGLDLATAAESVAERRSFFELKKSMTDVRGEPVGNCSGSSCNLLNNNSVGKGLNEVGTEFLGLRYLDATYGKDENMRRAQSTSSRTAVAAATVVRNTITLEPPKQTFMPFMGVPTSGDGKPLIELRWEVLYKK